MTEPTSVLPLAYYEQSAEPLMLIVRIMALAAIWESGSFLASYFWQLSFLIWKTLVPNRAGLPHLFGVPMQSVVEIPSGVAAIVLLVGAFMTFRMNSTGRKLLAGGAAGMAVVCALTYVFYGVFSIVGLRRQWGMDYCIYQIGNELLYAVQRTVLPSVLWFFFRRPAVVRLFSTAGT
jgi:hypothetical protein